MLSGYAQIPAGGAAMRPQQGKNGAEAQGGGRRRNRRHRNRR
jgi:hypothetical protein